MEKKIKINSKQKIQLVGALILLLCLLPLPYGFFSIVRVVTTIISVYLAYTYFIQDKNELAITFTVVAILFQPLIKLALGREIWMFVDVVVAILLIVLAVKKK